MPTEPTITEAKHINQPRVILILPESLDALAEAIDLTDTPRDVLEGKLGDHNMQQAPQDHIAPYLNLYNADGKTLDRQKVWELILARLKKSSEKAAGGFAGMSNLDLASIRNRVDAERAKRSQSGFGEHPEHDPAHPGHCDCPGIPTVIQKEEQAMNDFINAKKNSKGRIDAGAAGDWISGIGTGGRTLEDRLKTVARVARVTRMVYHEPHHELTPGMLLLDDIFQRMAGEAMDLVTEIGRFVPVGDAARTKALEGFQKFVNGLATGVGDSSRYGTYILPAGDHRCVCEAKDNPKKIESFHVDPSRIELFLDGTTIFGASLIVGAWKGGTHSTGHTSK